MKLNRNIWMILPNSKPIKASELKSNIKKRKWIDFLYKNETRLKIQWKKREAFSLTLEAR